MAKPTGKNHARINLDIWGNDDWLDLSPPAQHLYVVLWTSPHLSYCGAGQWHPGRISTKARGWTPAAVDAAGIELVRELFLLIDLTTEEFLLRSWIKHDGLWKQPNMAVSMADARAALASRTLRGVIVHEVSKLQSREPECKSWSRDAVVDLLKQKPVDPETLPQYTGYPGLNSSPNPNVNPSVNPYADPPPNGKPNPSANPPADPGRTPSPAPTSITPTPRGGYVTGERHQPPPNDPPNPFCPKHMPDGTDAACRGCGAAREARERWERQQRAGEANKRAAVRREITDCLDCDPNGWALDANGNPAGRCPKHDWEAITHA